DQLAGLRLERPQGADLVGSHQPAVAGHVGGEDRRQPPFDAALLHELSRAVLSLAGGDFTGPGGQETAIAERQVLAARTKTVTIPAGTAAMPCSDASVPCGRARSAAGRYSVDSSRRKILGLTTGAAALLAMSRGASAQAYPTRPVAWVAGSAPAGGNDSVARLMGQLPS